MQLTQNSIATQLQTFKYPCLIGHQGGRRVLTISAKFDELSRLLAADNFSHTLSRSQRELNSRRASAFADYVVNGLNDDSGFIIPPLIGNIEGDIAVEVSPEFPSFGFLIIPMNAKIVLFDGQHRQVGVAEVCQMLCNMHTQTVTVELSENLTLEQRQQFFSDINGNASKPNAAINLAYDRSNPLSQLVRDVVMANDKLKNKTDFERTNISSKSAAWVSFKSLCDASSRFIRLSEEFDATKASGDLAKIWGAWCAFTGLYDAGDYPYGEYSQEWLTFTAVMINGFGFAVQELLETMTASELAERLKGMSSAATRRERDDFFLYENWKGLCVSAETGKILANIKSQRAAATLLVSAIKAESYSL
ncbi:DGQHR domain-containing protein [Salmonella enterica]|nr:DGQHR domain-containing protein [Salmonella enterica]ECD0323815.1 DGQHR domain-containing protein [Salmonella enterica subsp. enterica serovar Enteritidis]EEL9185465.1 DGQHR domain-containing protein [Salmonella enterica]EIJ8452144.1 DGQHR domain-containing protein [Salmonella enterica]